jgi:RNA polymerase sigma factor (sigma-70 family)
MIKFYENDIFKRFNPNHEGLEKGKPEKKALEQYLLSWIRHYLEEAYFKRQKDSYRFIPVGCDNIEALHPEYTNFNKDSSHVDLFDEETNDEINCHRSRTTSDIRVLNKQSVRDRLVSSKKSAPRLISKAKAYPTIKDTEYYHSKELDSCEKVEISESLKAIFSVLTSEKEKVIVRNRLMNDMSMSEIAGALNITTSAISAILKRVKERCKKRNILTTI